MSTITPRVQQRPPLTLELLRAKRARGEPIVMLTADLLSLAQLVEAIPLAVLERAPGSTTLEMTMHPRRHPAPGWLAARNPTRHVLDGLHEEDVEIRDSAGKLVAQARHPAMLGSAR